MGPIHFVDFIDLEKLCVFREKILKASEQSARLLTSLEPGKVLETLTHIAQSDDFAPMHTVRPLEGCSNAEMFTFQSELVRGWQTFGWGANAKLHGDTGPLNPQLRDHVEALLNDFPSDYQPLLILRELAFELTTKSKKAAEKILKVRKPASVESKEHLAITLLRVITEKPTDVVAMLSQMHTYNERNAYEQLTSFLVQYVEKALTSFANAKHPKITYATAFHGIQRLIKCNCRRFDLLEQIVIRYDKNVHHSLLGRLENQHPDFYSRIPHDLAILWNLCSLAEPARDELLPDTYRRLCAQAGSLFVKLYDVDVKTLLPTYPLGASRQVVAALDSMPGQHGHCEAAVTIDPLAAERAKVPTKLWVSETHRELCVVRYPAGLSPMYKEDTYRLYKFQGFPESVKVFWVLGIDGGRLYKIDIKDRLAGHKLDKRMTSGPKKNLDRARANLSKQYKHQDPMIEECIERHFLYSGQGKSKGTAVLAERERWERVAHIYDPDNKLGFPGL